MNRTQVAILVSLAAVFGLSGLLIFKSTVGDGSKIDVLGIVPGMTHAQVEKVIRQRKWHCRPVGDEAVDCATEAGSMRIAFARSREQAPVASARIHLLNRENLSLADIARSVSKQYDSEPAAKSAAEYRWQIGNGFRLTLEAAAPDLTLTLADPALLAQEGEQGGQRQNDKP